MATVGGQENIAPLLLNSQFHPKLTKSISNPKFSFLKQQPQQILPSNLPIKKERRKKTKSSKGLKEKKKDDKKVVKQESMSEILKAQMKMDLDDKVNRIESLEEEISDKNSELQKLQEKITSLEDESKSSKDKISELYNKLEKQKEKQKMMEEKFLASNEEKTKLEQEKLELLNQKESLNDTVISVEEKCQRLAKDNHYINGQLQKKDEYIQDLRARCSKKDEQLSSSSDKIQEILLRRESLQSRYEQQSEHLRAFDELDDVLEDMKKDLFYSIALAIKLSYSANGSYVNFCTQTLLEKANKEKVRFTDYPTWLTGVIMKLQTVENVKYENIPTAGKQKQKIVKMKGKNTSRR